MKGELHLILQVEICTWKQMEPQVTELKQAIRASPAVQADYLIVFTDIDRSP